MCWDHVIEAEDARRQDVPATRVSRPELPDILEPPAEPVGVAVAA